MHNLYEYAKEHLPTALETLHQIDKQLADHTTAAMNLVRTRLAVLEQVEKHAGLTHMVLTKL